MARMNKLSDEITDRHEKKYTRVETKNKRVLQIIVVVGVLMMVMLISFIMTCRANAQKKEIDEDQSQHTIPTITKRDD